MNVSDLKELTVSPGRTAEEIGSLAKVIETRMMRSSLENARIFSEQIAAAGGKATLMPQNFYLSQGDLASNGECAISGQYHGHGHSEWAPTDVDR
ncbi:hypothetical protein VRB67_11855 [Pseudomonas trivialis]|uniref:hypothetical protein n=1 Tax=Pseudomonas trivialis TaxID=200450 RepID=UPI0030D303DA